MTISNSYNFMIVYLNRNLGDDLFLKLFIEHYRNKKFVIIADKSYKSIYRDNKNLIIVNRSILLIRALIKIFPNIFEMSLSKHANSTIYLGGSIFQENPSWYKEYKLKCKLGTKSKKKLIISASFGPYKSDSFFRSYKELFKSFDEICFRDLQSCKIFIDLNNIKYYSDLVFALKVPQICKIKNSIAISVIDLSKREDINIYKDYYENSLAKLIIEGIENHYSINLFSFCKNEGDEKAILSIKSRIDKKYWRRIAVFNYTDNISLILNEFFKSEIVIATRFHSMILALMNGSIVIPIIYSIKQKNVLNDIEFANKMFSIENLEELKINCIKKYSYCNIQKQIASSENMLKEFEKYL